MAVPLVVFGTGIEHTSPTPWTILDHFSDRELRDNTATTPRWNLVVEGFGTRQQKAVEPW